MKLPLHLICTTSKTSLVPAVVSVTCAASELIDWGRIVDANSDLLVMVRVKMPRHVQRPARGARWTARARLRSACLAAVVGLWGGGAVGERKRWGGAILAGLGDGLGRCVLGCSRGV